MRFFSTLAVLFFLPLCAQVKVNTSENLTAAIQRLAGKGVRISNVSMHVNPGAAGTFFDEISTIGMERGLLLTSGLAKDAEGPNDELGRTEYHEADTTQDLDLLSLADLNDSIPQLSDLCRIEFDIEMVNPTLELNYVFASEEYQGDIYYDHDLVGVFISGPGIEGTQNISVVPGTNIPVSVSNVNAVENNLFYVDNGTGSTPYLNPDCQYNGYTKVMKAVANVIPCAKYHIKIAVSDYPQGDSYDAAVFLQDGSFISSGLELEVSYEYNRFSTAIEGCNDVLISFKREAGTTAGISIPVEYKGSAVRSVDYASPADSIVFAHGQFMASISISALTDALADDGEFVRLVIGATCPFSSERDSIDIPVREYFEYNMPDVLICDQQSVQLNTTPITSDSIFWNASPELSCLECLSPVVAPHAADTLLFRFTALDTISGCISRDSVSVITVRPLASFSFSTDPCYTSLDYFFENKSLHGAKSTWDFGDGFVVHEQHPKHQFPGINTLDDAHYTVHLSIGSEGGCTDDTTVTISITEPFFIPNLLTANGDGKNDVLNIQGIQAGTCWQLDLYNEWGSLVFSEKEYQNNFDGADLAAGVYHWQLSNHYGDRSYKGWLHILK